MKTTFLTKGCIVVFILVLLLPVVTSQLSVNEIIDCDPDEVSITEGKITRCIPIQEPTMIGNSVIIHGRLINLADNEIIPVKCCYLSDVKLSVDNPTTCECVYYER